MVENVFPDALELPDLLKLVVTLQTNGAIGGFLFLGELLVNDVADFAGGFLE